MACQAQLSQNESCGRLRLYSIDSDLVSVHGTQNFLPWQTKCTGLEDAVRYETDIARPFIHGLFLTLVTANRYEPVFLILDI